MEMIIPSGAGTTQVPIDSTQAQGNNYFAGSHITATKYSFAYISEVAANQNQLNEKQLSEIIKSL